MKNLGDMVDKYLSSLLAGRFGSQSRRAFLSRMGRTVFQAAGVAVAARVGLEFRMSKTHADNLGGTGDWKLCGLHGFLCDPTRTNCGPPAAADALDGGAWIQCCKDPSCNMWVQCSYKDICSKKRKVQNASDDCEWAGLDNSNSIPSWCGTYTEGMNQVQAEYWCTVITCSNPGDSDQLACAAQHDNCEMRKCNNSTTGDECFCQDTDGNGAWKCCPSQYSTPAQCAGGADADPPF